MDWIVWAVAAIFLIGLLWGIHRGAIRIAVSLLTTLVTILIAAVATPYVADAVTRLTPLDGIIESGVDSVISSLTSSGQESDAESAARQAMDAAGVTEEDLEAYGVSEEDLAGIDLSDVDIPQEMQDEAIQSVDMPTVFKNLLTENNNAETYEQLGVSSFTGYVGSFLSKIIINVLSFLGIFLIVTIILRAVVFALDVVTRLPVIGAVNRLFGAVIGLFLALIVVWLIFTVITLLFTTQTGSALCESIQANAFTRWLFDNNPVLTLAIKS